MHLLLIHAYFLPTEAPGSIRWNDMARMWANEGHRLTVIAGTIDYISGKPYQANDLTGEAMHPNIRVIRAGMSHQYSSGKLGRLWAYFTFFVNSLWTGLRLRHQLFDAVIATSPPLSVGLTGWLLAAYYRKPVVVEIRDLWPDAPIQMGYLRHPLTIKLAYQLERFLYRRADRIVVVTTAFRQLLIEQKKVEADKLIVIPNGADFVQIEAIIRSLDVTVFRKQHGMSNGFWIIYAGSHGIANGLPALLQVADQLRHAPVQFLLVGNGPEKEKLQAEARRLQLPNMHFRDAGPKTDVLPFILAADAGLVIMQPLPIFGTMLSAKLFDYFACRKPVLTAIGGLTCTLVETANAGLYLDPAKPAEWAEKLLTYLNTADLHQQGENGYRLAKQQFDRQALALAYLNGIKQLVAAPKKQPTFL